MSATPLTDAIVNVRVYDPGRIAQVLAERPRATMPAGEDKLMIIACDHPARLRDRKSVV